MLRVNVSESEVAAAVAARTDALVSGDAERMREILADDFTAMPPS
jgi:hypothetical protein